MAEHFCKKHGVPFFKKGKMKGYAHPIIDPTTGDATGEWCNEPEEQAELPKKEWTPNVKSPEERISIERQKSADIAFTHAQDVDITEDILKEAEKIYQWIHNGVNPTATAVKDTPKTIEEAIAPLGLAIPEEDNLKVEPITTEQKERLKELQEKKPGRIKELIDEWGWGVQAISKLTKDQANRLIKQMEGEVKND